jgi:hypothetical protein
MEFVYYCCELACAAVFQVVTGNAGNNDIFQFHSFNRFDQIFYFSGIRRSGMGIVTDRAELAVSGAFIAQDHKSRGSPVPAFSQIRALSAGADGMQFKFIHEMRDFVAISPAVYFYPDPRR